MSTKDAKKWRAHNRSMYQVNKKKTFGFGLLGVVYSVNKPFFLNTVVCKLRIKNFNGFIASVGNCHSHVCVFFSSLTLSSPHCLTAVYAFCLVKIEIENALTKHASHREIVSCFHWKKIFSTESYRSVVLSTFFFLCCTYCVHAMRGCIGRARYSIRIDRPMSMCIFSTHRNN